MDQDPTQPYQQPSQDGEPPAPPAWTPAPPAAPAPPPAAPSPHAPPAASPYAPPASGAPAPQYGAQAPQPGYGAPSPQPGYGAPAPQAGFGGGAPIPPVATPPRRRGRNPLRYLIALVIVALVVAGGIGATLLLTGSTGGASSLAAYAPADTLAYAEGRLDLPGNQRAEVAKTLAAFPGFADQSSLSTKLGEVFDRIVKAASKDKHDYQTEIAPWFGGQLAIAAGPTAIPLPGAAGDNATAAPATTSPTAALPACTGGDIPTAAPAASSDAGTGAVPADARVLLLVSITDATKAEAWIRSIQTEAGATSADRTCDGVAVHLVQSAKTAGMPPAGWAFLGNSKVLALGDLDSIRLAIATKGQSGLSTVASFKQATAALSGDHIGFLFESLRSTIQAQAANIKANDSDGTATAAFNVLSSLTPEWMAGDMKAADGNVVIDTVQPKGDLTPGTARASDLAGLAPAKTVALLDIHDLGKTLGALKDKFAADPKLAPSVKSLDQNLALAGGFGATVGWIGDAGLAITRDGSKVSGGLLIRPDDAGAATRLFTQLRALLDIGGGSGGLNITDETYKGATITTIDLSGLAPALESGMGSSLNGVSVPKDLKFVYTATDKVVVLTLDPAFAKSVIDASQGGDSLAKDPRFSALLTKAGAQSTGLMWLDIAATRDLAEGLLPANASTKYQADVRPYVLPIDALMSVGTTDSDFQRGTMILSIKH